MIGNWVMENYLPRIADETLKKSLRASGAVLIEGPMSLGQNRCNVPIQ